jgi:hypothetical protein
LIGRPEVGTTMRSPPLLLLATLLIVRCSSTGARGPVAPPAGLVAATTWEPGTLVAPELLAPPPDVEPARTVVRVAIALIAARPEAGGERLADGVVLVADPRAEGSVKFPSPALVEGRTWRGAAARSEWEKLRELDEEEWALLYEREELAADSGATWFVATAGQRSIALAIQHEGAALRVAIERNAEPGERAKLAGSVAGEDDALLAIVGTPFSDGVGDWCALWLETRRLTDDAPDHGIWSARAAKLEAERDARFAAAPATTTPADDAPVQWSGLPTDGTGRRALAWWTERHRDTLAADFALAASDEALAELLATIAAPQVHATDEARIAALEKQAWRMVAMWDAKEKLPDELRAVLLRRGGVVATDTGAMESLAKSAGGLKEMQALLVEENRIALESSSAATRVRAFDWLTARGLAPAGYEPLAPSAERRKALVAANAERSDG